MGELSGPNYAAFDLMKVFRTAEGSSKECMAHFVRAYAASLGRPHGDNDVARMIAEIRRFEPLTWLEAAIFFLTLPQFKPSETLRWNDLAVDRWTKFVETKHKLPSTRAAVNHNVGVNNSIPACRQDRPCLDFVGQLL